MCLDITTESLSCLKVRLQLQHPIRPKRPIHPTPPETPDTPVTPDTPTGETKSIQGEYHFKASVTNDISVDENVPFTCNGKEYTGIIVTSSDMYYKTSVGSEWVATLTDGELTFFQDVFRTVNFSTALITLTLHNWIEANTYIPYYVSGTWYFNDEIVVGGVQDCIFTDGLGYKYKRIYSDGQLMTYVYAEGGGGIAAYSPMGWQNEAYRTITFDGKQEVSQEFYEWLVANAVRQTIGFTIEGTQYFADVGMTWEEWIDSEYNTGGFFRNVTYVSIGSGSHSHQDTVEYNGKNVLLVDVIQPLAYEINPNETN